MNEDILKMFALGFVFGCLSVIGFTIYCGHAWHSALVDEGYAEYYLDANHSKKWRMKPKENK